MRTRLHTLGALALLTRATSAGLALATAPASLTAQWVEPPWTGWASFALYHQNTRKAYSFECVVGAFPADGHAVATSSFLTLALGVV